ncbi:MAG: CPBP family intramembrane glutamic endopeptidase [Gemmatimonadales bacterium]
MLLALALGWWLGVAPFERLAWTWRGLAGGIAATAPLLLGLAWCLRTTWPPVARLVLVVEQRIAPLFAGSGPGALVVVALLAGLGEEALFRGVLQPALAAHLPLVAAVAVTATLFGLAHWITPTYAVLAGIVGAYLGWLLVVSGNLLVPVVAHALYDVVALALLVRVKPGLTSSVL